jgi:nitrate reductase cytochrome c-type subunit
MVQEIVLTTRKYGEKKFLLFSTQVQLIPEEVKTYILSQYLNACIFCYSLNFFKWRQIQKLKYKGIKDIELDQFIHQRLQISKERYKQYKNQIIQCL